jgi:hypothetical protein
MSLLGAFSVKNGFAKKKTQRPAPMAANPFFWGSFLQFSTYHCYLIRKNSFFT